MLRLWAQLQNLGASMLDRKKAEAENDCPGFAVESNREIDMADIPDHVAIAIVPHVERTDVFGDPTGTWIFATISDNKPVTIRIVLGGRVKLCNFRLPLSPCDHPAQRNEILTKTRGSWKRVVLAGAPKETEEKWATGSVYVNLGFVSFEALDTLWALERH